MTRVCRTWTPEEDKRARELRAKGLRWADVARELGRTVDSCQAHFCYRGDQKEKTSVIYETTRQRALRIKLYGEQRYT